MATAITKRVQDALRNRLAAAWAGTVEDTAPLFSLSESAVVDIAGIDWSGNRPQFYQGPISPDAIEDNTDAPYPLAVLAVDGAFNTNSAKFLTFAGDVSASLFFVLSWDHQAPAANMADAGQLVSDALVALLHDRNWVGALSQDGMSYSGQIDVEQGQITEGARGWRQVVTARMIFGVDA